MSKRGDASPGPTNGQAATSAAHTNGNGSIKDEDGDHEDVAMGDAAPAGFTSVNAGSRPGTSGGAAQTASPSAQLAESTS
jgi:hypothetical protein